MTPDISIIIPTLNRGSALANVLESVASVVSPRDTVEIIVVDNGSTDQTPIIFCETSGKYPKHHWRYFRDEICGLLSGRHRGAKEASGEILTFLDDDVILSPTWLKALYEAFGDPAVVLVGGPSRPHYEVEPPSWLEGLWWNFEGGRACSALSLIDLGSFTIPTDPLLVWGLNFSIRKTVFRQCGGFHPDCVPKALQRYQGDGETGLSLKIRARGLGALYHPGVAVTHVIPSSRLTVEAFEQRAFYQGVCASYTQIRRERRVTPPSTRAWKEPFRPIKSRLERMVLLRNPTVERIRRLMARAHYDGIQFHREEVRRDPVLLEWILKDNYFDYTLPAGWEDFIGI